MDSRYSNKIIWINFFMTFMIVIVHINPPTGNEIFVGQYQIVAIPFSICKIIIAGYAVPVFFAISGFLFYKNIRKSNLKSKIIKRFYTLIIPMFFYNCIAFLIRVCFMYVPFLRNTGGLEERYFDFQFILDCLILAKDNGTPLWYLRSLFVLAIFAPVLFRLLKNRNLTIIIILISSAINIMFPSIFDKTSMFGLPFYLIGALAAIHYQDLILVYNKGRNISALGIITTIIFFLIGLSYSNMFFVSKICFTISFWFMMDLICTEWKQPWGICKYSFFIYCTHMFVIKFDDILIKAVIKSEQVHVIFNVTIFPFIVVETCILLGIFLNRYFSKFYKIILGGRN